MIIYNGYHWTLFDLVALIAVVCLSAGLGITNIMVNGLSLSNVAGSIWGSGTLAFILIYPLPISGRSIEGEKLLKEKEVLTPQEAKMIWDSGNRFKSKIAPKTIKRFFLFFIISGGFTLIGLLFQI
ncbi:MAG: hypothetical protein P8X55_17855 [Desulfosarcinaceae bacterium]